MSRLSPGLFSPYKHGVFLWVIDKQNNPRCDAAKRGVPSGAILFPFKTFIERCKKNKNELFQMLRMGKPICHTYVSKYNRVTSLFSGRSR